MSRRDKFIQHARGTPFDNSTNDFISEDVQAAIEELANTVDTSASPGFTWGGSGNVTANSWLLNDTVPSNKAGRAIFLSNATLEYVFVRCENATTFNIEVYEHDGATFTLITTVTVTAARIGDFPIASIPITTGKELAMKLTNGSAKNPVVGCVLRGSF